MRISSFVGILGWPVGHSLSPAIHTAAFRSLGLDWAYLRFEVEPGSLDAAVAGLRALGAVGANVTMPHKEKVLEHLDDVSGDARSIGAVNTIHRVGDKLIGHNTDVDGFARMVTEDAGLDLSGARCLILGAGGAARAVVRGLEILGVDAVAVSARRLEQAEPVAAVAHTVASDALGWEDALASLDRYEIVVNATPLGMNGESIVGSGSLGPSHVVFDLVYDPPSTPLTEIARQGGARAWSGLGMLVHQAAASFRIWTGSEPPVEAMSAAAIHAMTRRDAHRPARDSAVGP